MKRHTFLARATRGIFLFALIVSICFAAARAQTSTFTYQGRLTDGANTQPTGTYQMQFALFGSPSDNDQIGSAVARNNLQVTNGVFSVQIKSSDIGANAFDGGDRYLEIRVFNPQTSGYVVLSPRQRITAAPYAIRAASAATADTATIATTATNTANFSGALAGDVTGTQNATVVSSVGGQTAANVAAGAQLANAATHQNTADAIVRRDFSGGFSAGIATINNFRLTLSRPPSTTELLRIDAPAEDSFTLSGSILRLRSTQFGGSTLADRFLFDRSGAFLALGKVGHGIIPIAGAGERMMWYAQKAAFRSGGVTADQWDDLNIGYYSWAGGQDTIARGTFSFSFGDRNLVTGGGAASFGERNSVTGDGGFSAGDNNNCSGSNCIAMGFRTSAAGDAAVALGHQTSAIGDHTVALGYRARTGCETADAITCPMPFSRSGSFIFADNSTPFGFFDSAANNEFAVRAAGGYRFFASSNTSDNAKPGLFIAAGTGNTRINGTQNALHITHAAASATNNTWGLQIQNSTVSGARGAMRLSNEGNFEITTNALDSQPKFARLSSEGVWTSVSDARMKRNILPITNLLPRVMRLHPVTYNYLAEKDDAPPHIGFTAQNVGEFFPSLVIEGETKTLNYSGLSVIAIGAIQEQQAEIERLKAQIETQRQQLKQQQNLIDGLKKLLCSQQPQADVCK